MTSLRVGFSLALVFLTVSANGQTTCGSLQSMAEFNSHVEIVRERSGRLTHLVLRANRPGSLEDQLTSSLKLAQLAPPVDTQEIAEAIAQSSPQLAGENIEAIKAKLDSAYRLAQTKAFTDSGANHKAKEILRKLDAKYHDAYLGQRTIAAPNSPGYFFRSTWRKAVLDWGTQIMSSFGKGVGANLAFYIFGKAVDDLMHRRSYYQNYVSGLLQTCGPESLGFTAQEGKLILSSIEESHLDFYEFKKERIAKSDWLAFGENAWLAEMKIADKRMTSFKSSDRPTSALFGGAFFAAARGGKGVILNARVKTSLWNKRSSLAYDGSTSLFRERSGYEALRLGLALSPVPFPLSSVADLAVASKYVAQAQAEGALYAEFSLENRTSDLALLRRQTVNHALMIEP